VLLGAANTIVSAPNIFKKWQKFPSLFFFKMAPVLLWFSVFKAWLFHCGAVSLGGRFALLREVVIPWR